MRGINPTYLEDVLPRATNSSDSNPILLSGVTAEQFQHYLLVLTCRPGDSYYPTFATGYDENWGFDRLQDVYAIYTDVATLARLFGMPILQEWAVDRLYSIFINPHQPLTKLASLDWSADSLLHLRTVSRGTKLGQPALKFIQYFISANLGDIDTADSSPRVRACVDVYEVIKNSDDNLILGCIFLNLLSLGHRSRVWSELVSRQDRAILYAAQVQFVDIAEELKTSEWLTIDPPKIELASYHTLCRRCETQFIRIWRKWLGQLGQGLGSGQPLKDVSLLSRAAKNLWNFYQEWRDTVRCCWQHLPTKFTNLLEGNRQTLYEEVASRYRALAE